MAEESTTIVIFGASGDLTRQKLLPALFSLYCKSRLPPGVRVVGFSRSGFSDDEFREMTWEGIREAGEPAGLREQWEEFARGLTDLGFERYPVPGAAHVEYWADRAIYDQIVHLMDLSEDKPEFPGSTRHAERPPHQTQTSPPLGVRPARPATTRSAARV